MFTFKCFLIKARAHLSGFLCIMWSRIWCNAWWKRLFTWFLQFSTHLTATLSSANKALLLVVDFYSRQAQWAFPSTHSMLYIFIYALYFGNIFRISTIYYIKVEVQMVHLRGIFHSGKPVIISFLREIPILLFTFKSVYHKNKSRLVWSLGCSL